jgi:predicted secreted Zn-dependent protease
MNKNVLLACATVWSMAPPPVASEPLVRVHTSYYYVDGPSATVLAAQIEQNGPPGADGKRYAGKTKWDVQWKFKHEQRGVTCEMKEAAVAVGVAQTLPRWRDEKKGVAALKARWRQFSDALKRHEDRHKDHGLAAGREIEAALLAAKPASNCEDLATSANSAADAIVKKYQKLDQEYDAQTGHGRSEGAVLL